MISKELEEQITILRKLERGESSAPSTIMLIKADGMHENVKFGDLDERNKGLLRSIQMARVKQTCNHVSHSGALMQTAFMGSLLPGGAYPVTCPKCKQLAMTVHIAPLRERIELGCVEVSEDYDTREEID